MAGCWSQRQSPMIAASSRQAPKRQARCRHRGRERARAAAGRRAECAAVRLVVLARRQQWQNSLFFLPSQEEQPAFASAPEITSPFMGWLGEQKAGVVAGCRLRCCSCCRSAWESGRRGGGGRQACCHRKARMLCAQRWWMRWCTAVAGSRYALFRLFARCSRLALIRFAGCPRPRAAACCRLCRC